MAKPKLRNAPRKWLAKYSPLLRLRPFETTSGHGRSRERARRVALSALGEGLSRGLRIIVALISVPLTLNYLGSERYGIWIAISTMVSMVGIADLGIGNGLISALAKCSGKDDQKAAREYVSSAFFGLLSIAIIIGLVFFIGIEIMPWGWLFNVSSPELVNEARCAAVAVTICFLIRFPLTVAGRIRRALQEGYIASLLDGCSSIVSLIALLVGIHCGVGLVGLVAILAGSPILGGIVNLFLIVYRDHPSLLPSIGSFKRSTTFSLLRVGWVFLGLQACSLIAYETDILVVSRMLGVNEVPSYSVPLKLFMILPMILTFVLRPLWPAYGEAHSRGDHTWIRKTLRQSVWITAAITTIGAVFLAGLCNLIIRIWVGPELEISTIHILGLTLYIILAGTTNAYTRFFQGIEAFRFLLISSALMAVVNFPLSVFLTTKIGVSGPIWGTVIAWFLFSLLPMIYVARSNSRIRKPGYEPKVSS